MNKETYKIILKKVGEVNKLYNFTPNTYINNNQELKKEIIKENDNIILKSFSRNFEDCILDIYLMTIPSVPVIDFDENYNMISKKTKLQYEVGLNIITCDTKEQLHINNVIRKFSTSNSEGLKYYNILEELLMKQSLEQILEFIINYLNDLRNKLSLNQDVPQ